MDGLRDQNKKSAGNPLGRETNTYKTIMNSYRRATFKIEGNVVHSHLNVPATKTIETIRNYQSWLLKVASDVFLTSDMIGKTSRSETRYENLPRGNEKSQQNVETINKYMSVGLSMLRCVIWMFLKSVHALFLPVTLYNLLARSKKCPEITDNVLLYKTKELAEKIRNAELKSEEVLRIYIKRIEEVNPIINAVVDERYAKALEDARRADELIASNKFTKDEIKTKFPLLGVPLTVKGSISVSGLRNTSGMVLRTEICETDAVPVMRAKKAGAIPLVTTNVPELCLNWETTNKLKGTTRNPYDTTKTVGGSSGGEAALMACGASLIGIGSDIAGSLRLPPHFCCVWGHKPTPGVVSNVGHYPSCKHHEIWESFFSLGPMARFAEDLRVLFEVIVEPKHVQSLNLSSSVDVKELKYYYIEDIGNNLANKLNANCRQSLKKVVEYFTKEHNVVFEKVTPIHMKHAPEIAAISLLGIDDVDNLFQGKGDGVYGELFKFVTFRSKSVFTAIAYGVLRKLHNLIPKSVLERNTKRLRELRSELLEMLGENGVLFLPVFTTEAFGHGEVVTKLFDNGYMSIFNSLGFPATSCPVMFTKNGLPVGVQVVAAPFCDRLTLGIAEEIQRAFGGWKPPKGP